MQVEYGSVVFACASQQQLDLSPDVCLRRVDDSIFAGFAAGQPSDVARFFGERAHAGSRCGRCSHGTQCAHLLV